MTIRGRTPVPTQLVCGLNHVVKDPVLGEPGLSDRLASLCLAAKLAQKPCMSHREPGVSFDATGSLLQTFRVGRGSPRILVEAGHKEDPFDAAHSAWSCLGGLCSVLVIPAAAAAATSSVPVARASTVNMFQGLAKSCEADQP